MWIRAVVGRAEEERHVSVVLTELQMRVMEAVWERGEATVSQVRDALEPERSLARTTVATLLSRLEEREILAHRARGREFVYRPLLDRTQVRRSMLREFADRVFRGDVTAMVGHLLGSREVDPEELRELRRLLAEKEEELRSDVEGGGSRGSEEEDDGVDEEDGEEEEDG